MPAAPTIGNTIAPPRFLVFLLLFAAGGAVALKWWPWQWALMAGFDLGAVVFLASCLPLFFHHSDEMRDLATRNDANRTMMLLISGLAAGVILIAVAVQLSTDGMLSGREKVGIAATLVLVWCFANAIWTLHYAHIYYAPGDDERDCAGIVFPGTAKPDMSDFTYFAFTIGVAAQTADASITSRHMRRIALIQSVAGFFFNLFVLALSINVLGAR